MKRLLMLSTMGLRAIP